MHFTMLSGRHGFGASLSASWMPVQVGSICLKLGVMTNNQAEYYGLLAGLEACKAVGVKRLSVLGDSQLVLKQVNIGLNCQKRGMSVVVCLVGFYHHASFRGHPRNSR